MRRKSSLGIIVLCTLLMVVIFFTDLSVPLGIATGALYVAVIVLGATSDSTRMTYFYAVTCSGLLLVGIYFYPIKVVPWNVVTLNRVIYIALIWCTTALIVRNQRTRTLLRERDDRLELANTQLQKLASHDYLTGLPNRRSFSERLDTECRRAGREHNELALLMIDVDLFKAYNDELGHQAGDRCLAEIAKAISAAVHRPADMVARYGGEEFAVILPATGLSGATEIAESVRHQVASLGLSYCGENGSKREVTVSLGVAAASLSERLIDPDTLIKAADQALYRAKKAGRNRVAIAKPVP